MITNEFCILCTGFSYSRQLILKRGSEISLKNIYYDKRVYFEIKLRFFNYI
jgi:hypothetical protein